MKIIYDASEPANTFSNLSYGDVFLYSGSTYIKAKPFGNRNAVNLLTGDSVHFCQEDGVIQVDASLVIRPVNDIPDKNNL